MTVFQCLCFTLSLYNLSQVFYEDDYKQWKLCSFEGEDKTCADQYKNTDVCEYLILLSRT